MSPKAVVSSSIDRRLHARSAARAEALDDGEARRDGPEEEAKGGGSLSDLAVVYAVAVNGDLGGDGDGASKPKDGCKGEKGQADDGVVEAREDALDEAGVEDDDESPDRVEKHEVEAGLVAVGSVNQVGSQAQLNDEKHHENGVDNGGDAFHCDGVCCCARASRCGCLCQVKPSLGGRFGFSSERAFYADVRETVNKDAAVRM